MTKNLKLMTEAIRDVTIVFKEMNLHVSDDVKQETALALFKARRWAI